MTLTVTSSSLTLACKSPSISHPWLPFAHLFREKTTLPKNNSPPSPTLLALSPQSHQKHLSRKTRGHLVYRYDRFHAHTQAHCSLGVYDHHFLWSPLQLCPFFTLTAPLLSPSKTPTKNRAWECTGIPFLIMPSPLPTSCHSQAALLSPRPAGFPRPFAYHYHLDAIPTSLTSSPPSDKTGAKSLTSPRNVNMFFYFATASRSSMQSSGDGTIEIRIYALSLKCYQGRRRRRRSMTLVKTSLCLVLLKKESAHWQPSIPWTEVVGKNLDDFLPLLHVE